LVVSFENKELRMVCENEDMAKEKFGLSISKKLQDRLADLFAATCVNDLLVGNPMELKGDVLAKYCVDLPDDYKLVFTTNHIKTPTSETGSIEWASVNRIKIISIQKN
jgi:plasmid maintenance system killer protein